MKTSILKYISWKFIALFLLLFLLLSSISEASIAGTRPKKRWRYIVIHHSATPNGNLRVFDRYHRKKRHMSNGVAYHFVICNGTNGSKDGQIQTSNRWKKQIHGGHCRKDYNNNTGIGICLVGNFEKRRPSEKQFWSTVWLTKKLMRECNIPSSRVKGHAYMKGEQTKCPGKRFPWKRFYRAIR